MSLNVLNIVESRCQWVIHVDDDDLPVSLLFVEQGHDSQDFDLLDLSGSCNKLSDLADIERIVITLGLGLGMENIWVLPSLELMISGARKEVIGART